MKKLTFLSSLFNGGLICIFYKTTSCNSVTREALLLQKLKWPAIPHVQNKTAWFKTKIYIQRKLIQTVIDYLHGPLFKWASMFTTGISAIPTSCYINMILTSYLNERPSYADSSIKIYISCNHYKIPTSWTSCNTFCFRKHKKVWLQFKAYYCFVNQDVFCLVLHVWIIIYRLYFLLLVQLYFFSQAY